MKAWVTREEIPSVDDMRREWRGKSLRIDRAHGRGAASRPAPRPAAEPTSPFRGVTWDPATSTWTATFRQALGWRYSKGHATDEAAARAYDAMARRQYGDRAIVNFPDGSRGATDG